MDIVFQLEDIQVRGSTVTPHTRARYPQNTAADHTRHVQRPRRRAVGRLRPGSSRASAVLPHLCVCRPLCVPAQDNQDSQTLIVLILQTLADLAEAKVPASGVCCDHSAHQGCTADATWPDVGTLGAVPVSCVLCVSFASMQGPRNATEAVKASLEQPPCLCSSKTYLLPSTWDMQSVVVTNTQCPKPNRYCPHPRAALSKAYKDVKRQLEGI